MVSKNNRIKKMEKAAERKPHFAIRKLTIGAASVLLGTTLWMSTTASISHADTNDDASSPESHEESNTTADNGTGDANKAVVITNNDDATKAAADATTDNVTINNDKSTETKAAQDENSSNSASAKKSAETKSSVDTSSLEKSNASASTVTTDKSAQASTTKANNNVAASAEKAANASEATKNANAKSATTVNNTEKAAAKLAEDANVNTGNITKSTVSKDTTITDAGKAGKQDQNSVDTQTFNLSTAALGKLTKSSNNHFGPKLAALFGTSLIQTNAVTTNSLNTNGAGNSSLINIDATIAGSLTDSKGKNRIDTTGFQEVSDWSSFKNAAESSSTKGVIISGNISANARTTVDDSTDVKINHDFTIVGKDENASISLNNNVIQNNANLTLADITVNGSIMGKGKVKIEGTVTSNADASNSSITKRSTAWLKQNLDPAIGTTNGADYGLAWTGDPNNGWTYTNWYNANITASDVTVDTNATLNIKRSVTGDGVELLGGTDANKKAIAGQYGTMMVSQNANLNITLKNGHDASYASNTDIDNANTAIRALHNGNFETGTGATVNLYAGHGRGIVFDEPFGGTAAIKTDLMTDWARNRSVVGQQNEAGAQNQFKLGNYTAFNLLGRDGVLLGNNATMNTGENSTVNFDNFGNGIGFQADAQARLVVGPHTVFLMHSDGKDSSGHWEAGNYIGMGENGQFTVAHDAVFKFNVKNACQDNTHPYADNFNIVSVKSDSNPTVNIENNAVFDGESDYRNIFGEILSFSYNGTPVKSTVNINGARYVNFQRHGATTPGGWQNVVAYDPQGKHSGNLFYSWPANTWNVNGNTYNVYKWTDETESQNTFNASDYDSLVKSIQDLNSSSSEYWTGVKNLTLAVNMHRSNLTDQTPNSTAGVKHGWQADDKNGHGVDTEFSQRLALVGTIIPTQEDKVQDEKNTYDVQIQYDASLKPGEVKLIQQGVAGRIITKTRTYYTVDLSDPTHPKKIIDTSKGKDGVETTVTSLSSVLEIIHVGPQAATIGYYHQDGNNKTAVSGIGENGIVTVSDNPIAVDASGNLQFDDNGNAIAANINYDYTNDFNKAKAGGYTIVKSDTWKNASHKYNVTGLTKEAIQQAAEKAGLDKVVTVGQATVNDKTPNFEVVVSKPEAKKGSVTVVYHDETTGQDITTLNGNQIGFNSGSEDENTPITYTTGDTIKGLTDAGYVYVSTVDDKGVATTVPTKISDKDVNVIVNVKHGYIKVDKNNPGHQTTTATVTRTVNYTVDGQSDSTLPGHTQTVSFSATGYEDTVTKQLVDVVNGNIVTENNTIKPGSLTWTVDGGTTDSAPMNGYTAPTKDHYHVDANGIEVTGANKSDNVENNGAVKSITVNHESHNIAITIPLVSNGTKLVDQGKTKTTSATVRYIVDGNDANKPQAPADNVQNGFEFTYSGDIYDAYTNQPISKGTWSPASHAYNEVTSPKVAGYTPNQEVVSSDQLTVTLNNLNPIVEVHYTKNAAEKANLKIWDDTSNVQLGQNIATQGDESSAINFNGANQTVQGYLDNGYKFVSVVSDANGNVLSTTSFDKANFGTFDTNPNSDQNFTVHLVHGTKPVNPENPTDKYTKNDLQKTSTRTINYVDENGNKIADSVTSTVVFSGSGYVDTVTGNLVNLNNDGSIKDQNGKLTWTYSVDGGNAQSGSSYTFAETAQKPTIQHDGVDYRFNNVNPGNYNAGNGAVSSYQVDNSKDNNLNVNVVYNKITYSTKRVNERTVNRTINYLDGKTGEKIPGNLIEDNPVNQSAKLYQTQIVDDQGNVKGIGTVNADHTSYTIDDAWHVDGSFDAVTSPDLAKSGYKAPRFENGQSAATVSAETVNENTPKQDTVNVYYDHNEVPVTPDNPHGVDPKQLTKDVKETVHYIGAGDKTPADNVQTSKWTRTLTLDEVTKELVPNGQYDTEWAIAKGEKTNYDQVNTPVVNGYYANKANVPATAVTQSNIYTEVTYKPLGHIIPVDPTTGDPIPNAPQPQFPNNPTDPTKGNPGEKPTVPGYHPESGKPGDKVTPNPGNPGEDVKVPYVKDQGTVSVIFHDDTTNSTIPNVGFNSGDAAADTPVTYNPEKSISDLEKQGYVYVRTEGTLPGKVEANKNITVTVHMKHGVQPVTPTTPPTDVPKNTPKEAQPDQLTKKVNLTVNYVNADGTTFNGNVPANAKQTATFTGTAYVDKITGQLVNAKQEDGKWVINTDDTATPEITWTSDKTSFEGVTSPAEKGYHVSNVSSHADGDNVAAITGLTKDSQDITVTVTYAKNGTKVVGERTVEGSMTVHYTGAGDLTPKDNVQSGVNFHYTGDVHDAETNELVSKGHWEVNGVTGDSYQFNEVDSPAVSGYTAEVKVVPGFKATPDKPTFETTVNYTKNGTDVQNEQHVPASQTVQYVDDQGNELLDAKNQKFEFNYSGDTVDKVTGETIKQGIWNETSHNFTAENVPVIKGYVAVSGYTKTDDGKYTAGGFTATNTGSKEDNNKVFKVVYKKVGSIVPQDPEGNPIPDPNKPGETVPNVPYKNDPTDPTKVTPNEKTPDIPGWHTNTPNVTPTDPTKDTPVIYNKDVQDQTVTVKYFDDTKETDLSSYNKSISKKPGAALNYSTQPSITELENKGYKLVSDNFNVTTMPEKGGDYEVHFVHNTTTITPDKPGKPGEPINPNDPNGPKWPEGTDAKNLTKQGTQTVHYVYADGTKAADDNVQNTTFAHTLVFDNVTGKQIEDKGWTPESHTFKDVTSPEIDGYHADKKTVAGATVTVNDPTSETTVIYAKNDTEIRNHQEVKASQLVKYVDEDGNELRASKNQNFTFTYTGDTYDEETGKQIATGKWNQTSTDFTSENVPVIDGYVAVKGYTRDDNDKVVAGGFTTSYDASDAKRNRTFTVVYKKVGKIVPVDPSKNPIPDAPTPSYENDPTDPTKVTPDEPTPNVPGYTPSQNTVTPPDPTKDTPVVYTKDQAGLTVQYIDQDSNNSVIKSDEVNGKIGDKIDYSTASSITDFENKGYVLVNDGFTGKAGADFTKDNDGKTYQVIFKHGTRPVNPDHPADPNKPVDPNHPDTPTPSDPNLSKTDLQKTITRTVEYQYADGSQAHEPVKQELSFTGEGTIDLVTGNLVTVDDKGNITSQKGKITWNHDSQDFKAVDGIDHTGYYISGVKQTNSTASVDPKTGAVGTESVTPTSQNGTIVITLTKNPDVPVAASGSINYIDDTTGSTIESANFSGSVGQKINYTTAQSIKNWEAKGYDLVSNNFKDGDEVFTDGKNAFEVHLKHATVPVTPDKPGKPGEPVDPSNPDNPHKYPDNYVPQDLSKTVTRDVTYVYADGSQAEAPVHQEVNFTGNGVLDLVTGGYVTVDKDGKITGQGQINWTPEKGNFDATKSIDTTKYNIIGIRENNTNASVDQTTGVVAGETVTQNSNNSTVVITLANKPAPVVQKGTITVTVHDVTTDTNLPQYGKQSGEQEVGTKFTYDKPGTISELEKAGYKVINPGVEIPTEIINGPRSATIYVEHNIIPVTPDKPGNGLTDKDLEKDVTRTVTYEGLPTKPNDVTDTLHFTGTGYYDAVTKKWTDANGKELADQTKAITWTSQDGTKFSGVTSPFNKNYHIVSVTSDNGQNYNDGKGSVTAITGIGHDSKNIHITVTYAQNGKIIPVDPSNKPIPDAPTPTYPTDPTDPTKVVPNEPVPEIPGMTPSTPTVTPTDPGKDTPVPYTPVTPAKDQVAQVIYRDVQDGVNTQLATSGDLSGKAGSEINYSTADTIKKLTDQGYVLKNDGFPAGAVFDNDDSKTQTFYVDFVHGQAPVNPDHPHDGVDPSEYTKEVKETVHYVGAGDKTPADSVQTSKWTRTLTVDTVTGKVIQNGQYDTDWSIAKGEKTVYDQVNTPVVDGYHADKREVPATAVTQDDIEVTVKYTQNGKIIPVGPDGKTPIPNVPNPTYPTDPTDPTKVVPDEPVPEIPGMTPSTPTVTPKDPGKDTPVPYTPVTPAKDQAAVVNYIDADNNNAIITSSGNLTGKAGSKIDYSTKSTITGLENKGYVLVNDGFPAGAKFDSDDNTTQIFTVVLKHGTVPVTPDKPGKPGEPINPNDPDGPKWPEGTDENSVKRTGTQTIHYEGAGENTPKDDVQTFDFTKKMLVDKVTGKIIDSGEWNVTSHTFGYKDTPVIDGYHADKRNAGGSVVTPDDLNKTVTVTYTQNGKIIPVGPDGKTPIPNVPNPTYPTDPTDPTKVTPDEPVPEIPGMTPNKPTVTPTDPGKDTPVPYTPVTPVVNTVTGKITYIDDDATGNKILDVDNFSGKVGDKIDYTTVGEIQSYVNKGYVLVSNNFKDGDETFAKDGNVFEVHFKHGTTTVTPEKPGKPGEPIDPSNPEGPKYPAGTDEHAVKRTGTQTVHFTGAGDKTPADKKQSFDFTRKITFDNVTGKIITTTPWNESSHTFGYENVPVVDGFHTTVKTAGGTTVTPDDLDKTVTVNYSQNGKIIPVDPSGKPIPNAPTPTYPTDPTDPTKVVPNEPVPNIPGMVPSQNTVTPSDPGKDTPVIYNNGNTPVNPDTPTTPTNPTTPTTPMTPDEPTNVTPHAETPETPSEPEKPSDDNETVKPHANAVPKKTATKTVTPHAQREVRITKNGNIINSKGHTIGYVDDKGQVHKTLPQTGDSAELAEAEAILGGIAAGLGLIGLAGSRKRRRGNK